MTCHNSKVNRSIFIRDFKCIYVIITRLPVVAFTRVNLFFFLKEILKIYCELQFVLQNNVNYFLCNWQHKGFWFPWWTCLCWLHRIWQCTIITRFLNQGHKIAELQTSVRIIGLVINMVVLWRHASGTFKFTSNAFSFPCVCRVTKLFQPPNLCK